MRYMDVYVPHGAHAKGCTSPKDGLLPRLLNEIFRGWIHKKIEVNVHLYAP